MKESEITAVREKVRLASMGAVSIVILLCVTLFIGCGTSGSSSVSYVGSNTAGETASPSAALPLQNEPLDILTDDEKEGSGLEVSYLGALGESIYSNPENS